MDQKDRWPSGASVLGVRNIEAAAAFLKDRLGFTITNLHGSPAFFAIASRDDCKVMLRPCQFMETRIAPDWSVYVGVVDVSGLHAEIKARGAPVTDLVEKDYGVREFEVRGPERHVFVFGQPIAGAQ